MDDCRKRHSAFRNACKPRNSKRSTTVGQSLFQAQNGLSADITEVTKDGVKVRVIAGEALGTQSPIYTRTPTMFLNFTHNLRSSLEQLIPPTWNSFIYIIEGNLFGNLISSPITAHNVLVLGPGDVLEAWNNSSKPFRFILVGGEPLGEPVVQLGPFVMNIQEEINMTLEDYGSCINGFEKAKH